MTSEENLKNEQQKNIAGGLTFEASSKKEEITIDEKAGKPKRDLVRERTLRTARLERSRKRT